MTTLAEGRAFKLTASISGTKLPMTRSGDAVLVELTDDEARDLIPGDVVCFQNGSHSLTGLEVVRVRDGVAEDGNGRPFAVPVVDGFLLGTEQVLAVAVPELWLFVETEERVDRAALSLANFASWAGTGG